VAEEHDGGAIVVELEVSHRDGFRSFVLGFLEHAEVLSPADLRADVVSWLDAVAAGP
jgi:predicted DNA-binding transcriptional regulator YafY